MADDETGAEVAREEAAVGRMRRLREAAVRMDSHPPSSARSRSCASARPATPVCGEGVGPESALVEVGKSALQVWQSIAENAGRERGEREVTIVFTDLVGFSSWALRAGDEAALELLRRTARPSRT